MLSVTEQVLRFIISPALYSTRPLHVGPCLVFVTKKQQSFDVISCHIVMYYAVELSMVKEVTLDS